MICTDFCPGFWVSGLHKSLCNFVWRCCLPLRVLQVKHFNVLKVQLKYWFLCVVLMSFITKAHSCCVLSSCSRAELVGFTCSSAPLYSCASPRIICVYVIYIIFCSFKPIALCWKSSLSANFVQESPFLHTEGFHLGCCSGVLRCWTVCRQVHTKGM